MRRYFIPLLLLFTLGIVRPVLAHANLVKSDPAANSHLMQSPRHIHLWFSEPLEPRFSSVQIRNASGETLPDFPQSTDSADPYQMVIEPEKLPDGLYTVTWRAVSATDGHATEGSFAFTIGAAPITHVMTASAPQTNLPSSTISLPQNAFLRGLNFISQAWLMGAFGFVVFVWRAAGLHNLTAEQTLRRTMWIGWILVGAASLLILGLQSALFAGVTFDEAMQLNRLIPTIDTRFGMIWLVRMALWGVIGVLLRRRTKYPLQGWLPLILSAGILLTTSLHSHADTLMAVTLDWLHLLATSVWIGGLIGFVVVLFTLYQQDTEAIPILAKLVAYFSNLGRVAVITLIITGTLTAWRQLGALDALFNTTYGQILLLKILLFLPLLVIAGVNLIFTARGLRQGNHIWSGRLRGLVASEILFGIGVMMAAGALTSVNPKQAVLQPESAKPQAEATPETSLMQMQMSATLHAHLMVTPGSVGENTFILTLYGLDDKPVTDATRIRMRFENLDTRSGESELRPELNSDGEYIATGANMSLPGKWRIRTTIQRPGEYDSVVDFEFELANP